MLMGLWVRTRGRREESVPGCTGAAGLKLLSGLPGLGRAEPKGTCPSGKKIPGVLPLASAAPAGAHSEPAWETQATASGRPVGAHSKGKWMRGCCFYIQPVFAQTRPSSAKVVCPVRSLHQSTRKRRATATRICFLRPWFAPVILAWAHFTT